MTDIMRCSPASLFGGHVSLQAIQAIRREALNIGPMTVVIDATVPPGTVRFEQDGVVVGEIVNIGADTEILRPGPPRSSWDPHP